MTEVVQLHQVGVREHAHQRRLARQRFSGITVAVCALAQHLERQELAGRRLEYADLTAAEAVALGPGSPDRELEMVLAMADGGRQWLINGRRYQDTDPLPVKAGERIRLLLRNQSMMFHPMHLHGHTFALDRPDGRGIRKDTVNVLPMQQLALDLIADNPGQWLAHCHNAYHAELGMMTTLSYRA